MENERLPENLFDVHLKIEKEIRETEEEFVYRTISPYCENIVEKKLSKEDLKDILTKGMQAESKANDLIAEIEWERKWLSDAGYNVCNVDMAFASIIRKIRKEFLGNGSNRD